MAFGHDNLEALVDEFGRTADFVFQFDTLMDFLEERLGSVDEAEAFDLLRGSDFVFEIRKRGEGLFFLPRRRFFQGVEFLVAPEREEVEGGFLFPGHRFMPFVSRTVFPADCWLVQPDGSSPHVRPISLPTDMALRNLSLLGDFQVAEYLETDDPGSREQQEEYALTCFDLRDFYFQSHFRPGDLIQVRVLDWLQGVLSISKAPERARNEADRRAWTQALRAAHDRMQEELGIDGDCYEQMAITLLLAREDDAFPVLKDPVEPLLSFFTGQDDIAVKQIEERAVFVSRNTQPAPKGSLDDFFEEMDLPFSEGEVEAYMYDTLFRGRGGSGQVLSRIVGERPLLFRSAAEQELFHRLWGELWEDVSTAYSPADDPFGELRGKLLDLRDRHSALHRQLDEAAPDPDGLLMEMDMLSSEIAGVLMLMTPGLPDSFLPEEFNINSLAQSIIERLPAILDQLEGK